MKTVSILQYDHDMHQFYPSFVLEEDFRDSDHECAFDELVIQPSQEWMEDYLQWNRFGRLPDDPTQDENPFDDTIENDPTAAIPVFESLQELHEFNAMGLDLTRRLQKELEVGQSQQQHGSNKYIIHKCPVKVALYKPLYSNMVVGPAAAWWHLKDRNYNFVVPVQRLPISDQLKSRLQAFRCHKGMGLWRDPAALENLLQEGKDLQKDLLRELNATDTLFTTTDRDSFETNETEDKVLVQEEKVAQQGRDDNHRSSDGAETIFAASVVAEAPVVNRMIPCKDSPRSVKCNLFRRHHAL